MSLVRTATAAAVVAIGVKLLGPASVCDRTSIAFNVMSVSWSLLVVDARRPNCFRGHIHTQIFTQHPFPAATFRTKRAKPSQASLTDPGPSHRACPFSEAPYFPFFRSGRHPAIAGARWPINVRSLAPRAFGRSVSVSRYVRRDRRAGTRGDSAPRETAAEVGHAKTYCHTITGIRVNGCLPYSSQEG